MLRLPGEDARLMDLLGTSINAAVVAVVGALLAWLARGRFDALDRTVDRLETQLVGTETRLDGRIAGMETRLVGTESRLEGRIVGMETRLDERIGGMETRLDGRIDGLDGRIDGVETRLDGMGTRLDGMGTRLDARIAGWKQSSRDGSTPCSPRWMRCARISRRWLSPSGFVLAHRTTDIRRYRRHLFPQSRPDLEIGIGRVGDSGPRPRPPPADGRTLTS